MTVTFHIGFPKTGTSTLQVAFSANPSISYLGKNFRDAPAGREDPRIAPSKLLADAVFSADDAPLEKALPTLQTEVQRAVEDGKSVFISDEAFTFAPFMPVARNYADGVVLGHDGIARRLHAIAPDANVLVTLREQQDFLKSWYLQKRKRGESRPGFDRFLNAEHQRLGNYSLLDALKYDEMYQAYADLFGPERVHVNLFETVKRNFAEQVSTAAKLTGIDVEKALDIWGNVHTNTRQAVHPLFRRLGSALPPPLRRLVSGPLRETLTSVLPKVESDVTITPEQAKVIAGLFADSNRRVAEMTGLDLASAGYALAEKTSSAA